MGRGCPEICKQPERLGKAETNITATTLIVLVGTQLAKQRSEDRVEEDSVKIQTVDQLRGRRLTLGMSGVTVRCHCGFVIRYQNENLGCIECGEPCCPACAFTSEGVVYCATCAREVYGLASRANTDEGWGLTYSVAG